MKEKRRVGIMGGTFDPIHIGHLLIAENAYDTYRLDEILFIPSGTPYMKKEVLPGEFRAAMTKIAIEGNEHFSLSMIEIEREGNTYTWETLSALKACHPDTEYFFVLGADSLFSIENWSHPELIFEKAAVLLAVREGYTNAALDRKIEELQNRFHGIIYKLPIKHIDISSTEIRQRAKTGQSIRYMVPEKVLDYIQNRNIYSMTNNKQP